LDIGNKREYDLGLEWGQQSIQYVNGQLISLSDMGVQNIHWVTVMQNSSGVDEEYMVEKLGLGLVFDAIIFIPAIDLVYIQFTRKDKIFYKSCSLDLSYCEDICSSASCLLVRDLIF
jgi:hypothetical protein